MAIFKYTLIKFSKSFSTWFWTVGSLLFMIIFTSVLLIRDEPSELETRQVIFNIILPISVAFLIVFSASKAVNLYRDEIEDGTFLTMLSKPYSRSGLLGWKILGYFTINIIFIFVSIFGLVISILLFGRSSESDINSTVMKSDLGRTIGTFLLTSLVFLLVTSSFFLLMLVNLSSRTAVSLSCFISFFILATDPMSTPTAVPAYSSSFHIDNKTFNKNLEFKHEIITESTQWTEYSTFVNQMYEAVYSGNSANLINDISYDGGGLSTMEILVGKPPIFSRLVYLDLNYQLKQISSIVNNTDYEDFVNLSLKLPRKQIPIDTYDERGGRQVYNNINKILNNGNEYILKNFSSVPNNQKLLLNWNDLIKKRELESIAYDLGVDSYRTETGINNFTESELIQMVLFGMAQPDSPDRELPIYTPDSQKYSSIVDTKSLTKIEYTDYLNKYGILATYLVIAAVLLPLTFYVLKRTDFK